VAAAGVKSTIGDHSADLFALGDLVQQLGKTGLSPSLLGVNSTARMSEVAVSIANCS
jgi:hypothetical protein